MTESFVLGLIGIVAAALIIVVVLVLALVLGHDVTARFAVSRRKIGLMMDTRKPPKMPDRRVNRVR